MSLKVSIASSRKIGEPNYGSRGATVGLELEVDARLAGSPCQLQACVARLFILARRSVDAELASPASNLDREPSTKQLATNKQVRAIQSIASRMNIDVIAELKTQFGVDRPEDLSRREASQMIESMVSLSNGAKVQT
jgi:hypothetical protein